MRKFVKLFVRDERGVSALEYAVLAGIVVAAVVAAGATFSTDLSTAFTTIMGKVTTAATSGT